MRLILLLGCLFLTACGQKGDLYLPGPPDQETAGTQAADAEKDKDEDKKS